MQFINCHLKILQLTIIFNYRYRHNNHPIFHKHISLTWFNLS